MPTTETPGAHELITDSNAVRPSNVAPYPTEVGTATIGLGTSPASTVARDASMPATATITDDSANPSIESRSRCRPATPTSRTARAGTPSAVSVPTHSSTTDWSEVPPETTATGATSSSSAWFQVSVSDQIPSGTSRAAD